jgi:flagella basal body P-ring formation protein FlgA
MPMTRTITIGLLLLCGASTAIADSIQLRRSARLLDGDIVHLRDIAELDGTEAVALGDVVLATMPQDRTKPLELHIVDIRNALELDRTINWGRIEFNGGTVIVRHRPIMQSGPPLAMRSIQLLEQTRSANRRSRSDAVVRQQADELIGLDTLRGWLARAVTAELDVSPTDLQLAFDADDEQLLDAFRNRDRFETRPMNNFKLSKRCDFDVRRWEGDTPADRQIISVEAWIRTELALPKSQIPRGQTLAEADLVVTERWLTPLEHGELAPARTAIGHDSASVLRTDSPIRRRDLRPRQIIRRGDTVHVDCLVGGGVISMMAVATEGAALGDMITLRKGRDRESFTAKVTGSGRAMVDRTAPARTLAGTKLADAATQHTKDMP